MSFNSLYEALEKEIKNEQEYHERAKEENYDVGVVASRNRLFGLRLAKRLVTEHREIPNERPNGQMGVDGSTP